MARQTGNKSTRNVPSENNPNEFTITTALSKIGPAKNPPEYINHAQFTMTTYEFIMELYKLTPITTNVPPKVEAELIQRVFIPHTLAKGFVTAMANVIDSYEREHNVTLQNNRNPSPDDTLEIWK